MLYKHCIFFFKSRQSFYLLKIVSELKFIVIKMVHLPLRLRDGQTVPILHKSTAIKSWRKWPRESFSWTESFSLDQDATPVASLQGDLLSSPFPDRDAYKLGFLHLTSKSVCKLEAAKVGGCETCKLEDSSENAIVEQFDLASPLSIRVIIKPVHAQ